MNREKVIEAILKQNVTVHPNTVIEAVKYMSDMNLIAFAYELGIDVKALLSSPFHCEVVS